MGLGGSVLGSPILYLRAWGYKCSNFLASTIISQGLRSGASGLTTTQRPSHDTTVLTWAFTAPIRAGLKLSGPRSEALRSPSQTARGAGVCCKTFAQEGYCVLHEVRLASAPFWAPWQPLDNVGLKAMASTAPQVWALTYGFWATFENHSQRAVRACQVKRGAWYLGSPFWPVLPVLTRCEASHSDNFSPWASTPSITSMSEAHKPRPHLPPYKCIEKARAKKRDSPWMFKHAYRNPFVVNLLLLPSAWYHPNYSVTQIPNLPYKHETINFTSTAWFAGCGEAFFTLAVENC